MIKTLKQTKKKNINFETNEAHLLILFSSFSLDNLHFISSYLLHKIIKNIYFSLSLNDKNRLINRKKYRSYLLSNSNKFNIFMKSKIINYSH